MRFCPKCETRLRFRQVRTELKTDPAIACDKCGYWEPVKKTTIAKSNTTKDDKSIKVVGADEEEIHTMPTTNVECPKCGNNEAFWWFLQTRGGDEPTTQFYRCKKCEHTWREYA